MKLAIKAPVGDTKRITKPDPKKKNQKFLPVKNAREDVELVQLMLVANGHAVPVDGKISAGVIKAIRTFQKSACGFKRPDGIVDPGLETWKAGLPKLKAKVAADMKELENRVQITENGKTKIITRQEFEKRQAEALKELADRARMMKGQAESWVSFCEDAEETMQGQDSVMEQLVEFTVRWANEKAAPPWTKILNARSEATFLLNETSRSTPDWQKILRQDKKATKAYNDGVKAFKTYIQARIKTASGIASGLTVVRETSFAVVEAYVTAQVMARTKMNPVAAHAVASGSVGSIKSSAGQFGEYLAGNDVTWDGAAKKVAFDTFFAAGAGAIGGKLTGKMLSGVADDFAKRVGGTFISKTGAEKYVTGFLKSTGGQTFIENAGKETLGLCKKRIEKGELKKKDYEDALINVTTAGLLAGGVGKTLSDFDKAMPGIWSKKMGEIVDKSIFKPLPKKFRDQIFKGLGRDLEEMYKYELLETVLDKHGKDIVAKVINTTSGKPVEAVVHHVLENSKGTENAKQLGKMAEEEIRKDKALRKQIEAIVAAEVKRHVEKEHKAMAR